MVRRSDRPRASRRLAYSWSSSVECRRPLAWIQVLQAQEVSWPESICLQFGLAFLITFSLELPWYWIGLPKHKVSDRLALCFFANLLSYPIVFFVSGQLPISDFHQELLAEIWAPTSECGFAYLCLEHWTFRESAVIVVANLFSWMVGRYLVVPLWPW